MEPLMIKIIIALRLRTVVLRLTSVCLKIILIMSVSSLLIFGKHRFYFRTHLYKVWPTPMGLYSFSIFKPALSISFNISL